MEVVDDILVVQYGPPVLLLLLSKMHNLHKPPDFGLEVPVGVLHLLLGLHLGPAAGKRAIDVGLVEPTMHNDGVKDVQNALKVTVG